MRATINLTTLCLALITWPAIITTLAVLALSSH